MRARWWLGALCALLLPGAAGAASCRATITPAPPVNPCAGSDRVSIAAVGDIMVHAPLQRRGYDSGNGFRDIWRTAEPFLSRADIAYGNLETPLAVGITASLAEVRDPGARFDDNVYTDYPRFNAHARLARQLKAAGFDVVSTANNHAMDRGPVGADRTIAALRAAGLPHVGTIPSGAPRDFVTHVPSPRGRVAFIACSFDTNGLSDPARQVLLCYRDRAELLALIRREAAANAAVVVTPHWGTEFSASPDAQQKALAREMAAAGATLVIGTHPHVVQPWEWLPGPYGQVPVLYSTGNFVSAQLQTTASRTGILAWLEMCPAPGGRLMAAQAGWIPLVMYRTDKGPWLSVAGQEAKGGDALGRSLVADILPSEGIGLDFPCRGD